ncbi:MAG TPA: hypothetical protein VF804_10815 [Holophagaceae bacterium]
MRSLAALGLIVLSTLPLAARDHGRWACRPRPVVVLEARPGCYDRSYDGYDRFDRDDRDGRYDRYERYDRDDDRWEGRACRADRPRYRAYDDDDVVVVRPRPLAPPWRGRVVLRFGW